MTHVTHPIFVTHLTHDRSTHSLLWSEEQCARIFSTPVAANVVCKMLGLGSGTKVDNSNYTTHDAGLPKNRNPCLIIEIHEIHSNVTLAKNRNPQTV